MYGRPEWVGVMVVVGRVAGREGGSGRGDFFFAICNPFFPSFDAFFLMFDPFLIKNISFLSKPSLFLKYFPLFLSRCR